MKKEMCPCKGCEDLRSSTCHATCKDYKEWSKQIRVERKKEHDNKPIYPASYGKWYVSSDGYWRNNEIKKARKRK